LPEINLVLSDMDLSEKLKPGIYRHFKGQEMKVLGVVKNSETMEDFVVYDHLGTNPLSDLWVRPLSMFLEEVEKNGYKGPRFIWIREE